MPVMGRRQTMVATALGSTVAAVAAFGCDGKLVGGAEGSDAGDASADVAGDAGGGSGAHR